MISASAPVNLQMIKRKKNSGYQIRQVKGAFLNQTVTKLEIDEYLSNVKYARETRDGAQGKQIKSYL